MSTSFSGQILAEKLSKLNSSQQSIESLSQLCVSHRKKAKLIVETWDKLYNSAQREKRVSFLYLANDILQNSRRKGSEFVNEFWKVLPAALKDVFANGDDNGKKAATRLVDIWDERKVFGSRGRSLKDEMLGKDPPLKLENIGKNLNSIKVMKKDAHSIRIRLSVGGMPEKIVTAFQSVHDENVNEDDILSKCKAAVCSVEKMDKDVDTAYAQGNQQVSSLSDGIQEQENILRLCVEKLKSVEANRESLVMQLKEALKDQESMLELIRNQLQVAHARIDQATNVKQRLSSGPAPCLGPSTTTLPVEASGVEPSPPPLSITSTMTLPPLPQPVTSFATSKTSMEEDNKKAAAAVAAKLAASASSAQMFTAVLSSLAAEEAASMNGGLKSGGFTSLPFFPPEKRPRLENPMPVSDMGSTTYFSHVHQPPLPNPLPSPSKASSTGIPPTSQPHQMQPPFPPPPPPPPPLQQYVQSTNVMVGTVPYRYGANVLPPPPPPPMMGSTRPGTPQTQPQQQQPPQPQQQQQQQPATGGYYQQHGIAFYGQSNHQPTPPAVPRS